jgi:hypothetical protein
MHAENYFVEWGLGEKLFMNTLHQVSVFDDADMIREAITSLCHDKLRNLAPEEAASKSKAIDALCWEAFPLQGKNFPYQTLLEKCAAVLARSPFEPIRTISPADLLKEISTPVGGW